MDTEISKKSGIELLFEQRKAAGSFRDCKNYVDYLAKRKLVKVRDVHTGEIIPGNVEFMIGYRKQRPLFGYED